MRIVFAVCAALLLSTAAPSVAATPAQDGAPASRAPQTRAQRLDALFASLKRERNEKAAERIAGQIFEEWNHSGSASIDLMMQWSQKAIEDKKYAVALDSLDEIVTLQPT